MSTTPIGRFSFPHIFTPRAPAPGAEAKYSLAVIWDEDAQKSPEYKAMVQEIMKVARELFGDSAEEVLRRNPPIRDAAEKDFSGYEQGHKFANFKSKQQPGIVDAKLQDVIDSGYAYPGCMGRVTFGPYAYDVSGNKGVALGLNNIQVTDVTTPRLDGRKAASTDFGAVATSEPDLEMEDVPF